MNLRPLLGHPDEEGDTDLALVAISENDFAPFTVSGLYDSISAIATAPMPEPLALLATACAISGAKAHTVAYVSLFRICQLYRLGTQYRGYSSFTAFVDDLVGPHFPISRSNIFHKVDDIDAWRGVGADWDTIRDLLAKTPMAGRDAVELLIEPQRGQAVVDHDTGEITEKEVVIDGKPPAEYLQSLTHMGPGEARRDVRDKAGIEERYIKEVVYEPDDSVLAIHAVWGNTDKDFIVLPVEKDEALWLCEKLRVRMEVANHAGAQPVNVVESQAVGWTG